MMSAMGRFLTMTSFRRLCTSSSDVTGESGVTSPIQRPESPGLRTGTGMIVLGFSPATLAYFLIISLLSEPSAVVSFNSAGIGYIN